jgi:predicted transcriptional regulator
MKQDTETVTLRMPAAMAQELEEHARRTQRSRSGIVRLALAEYFKSNA